MLGLVRHSELEDARSTDLDEQLLTEKVDMLFKGTQGAVGTLLGVGALFAYLLLGRIDLVGLVLWYVALCATLLGRLLLSRRYVQAARAGLKNPRRWLNLFRAAVASTTLVLGSLLLLIEPTPMDGQQLLIMLFLVGLTAGALARLPDLPAFSTYVVFVLGPFVGKLIWVGNEQSLTFAALTVILMLTLLRFSQQYNDILEKTLRMQIRNHRLQAELKTEKSRLDNRLGRVLNDSSAEILIVNARSLRCLQGNSGALSSLGYSPTALSHVRLPELVEGIDEDAFEQLIAPLRQDKTDFIFYSGRLRRANGSSYPAELRLHLSSQEVPPIIVVTALDITERNAHEQKLSDQANYDQLTQLPNRRYMLSCVQQGFIRAERQQSQIALLYMDLDHFKHINDSLGHTAGDALLLQAAARIRSVLRASDTAARMGGDEFLVMLEGLHNGAHAQVVADKLVNTFKQPFELDGHQVFATTSVGISLYPQDGTEVENLIQNADTAMYEAKTNGRSGYRYFSSNMRQEAEKRLIIGNQLRQAISAQELFLVYQPMIDLETQRIVGAEALLRWNNPELGMVSPSEFIPIAESMGLIEAIGRFVMQTACIEAQQWETLVADPPRVSLNVSSQQFRNGNLIACVDEALQISGLAASRLELEITESLLIQDSEAPLDIIRALRERAISLALDDFGTGYSSLSYLKRFPLQILKIDRSFISDIGVDKNDEALVEAIIAMAKSMDLHIVGEGVENEVQLKFLRERGVQSIQGYFYSPPLSVSDFRKLLQTNAGDLNPRFQPVSHRNHRAHRNAETPAAIETP